MSAQQPPINSAGNAAYVHRLKCWAENFDAIVSGRKRAEVRTEEDRKFKAGDVLELTRTDRDGNMTLPRTFVLVEVLHVERYAGPLQLIGMAEGGAVESSKPTPIVVLSLHHLFKKFTEGSS